VTLSRASLSSAGDFATEGIWRSWSGPLQWLSDILANQAAGGRRTRLRDGSSNQHFHETILAQSDMHAGSDGSVALRNPAVPVFVEYGDDILTGDVDRDLQQARSIAADLNQRLVDLIQDLVDLRRRIGGQIIRHFHPASDASVDDDVRPTRGIANSLNFGHHAYDGVKGF